MYHCNVVPRSRGVQGGGRGLTATGVSPHSPGPRFPASSPPAPAICLKKVISCTSGRLLKKALSTALLTCDRSI